jgi:hypothetical protein
MSELRQPIPVEYRSHDDIDARLAKAGLEDVDRIAFMDGLRQSSENFRLGGGTPNGVLGVINDAVIVATDQLGSDTPESMERYKRLDSFRESIIRAVVEGDASEVVWSLHQHQRDASLGRYRSYGEYKDAGATVLEQVTTPVGPEL